MNWLRTPDEYGEDYRDYEDDDVFEAEELAYDDYEGGYDDTYDEVDEGRQIMPRPPICRFFRPPCRFFRPPCRFFRPPCRFLRPPCRFLRPPCRFLRPPCRFFRPPCRFFRPPCRFFRPPCRFFRPPCRFFRSTRDLMDGYGDEIANYEEDYELDGDYEADEMGYDEENRQCRRFRPFGCRRLRPFGCRRLRPFFGCRWLRPGFCRFLGFGGFSPDFSPEDFFDFSPDFS